MERALLTWVLAVLTCTAAKGQEWTRFRGPNGSGHSEATTIPAAWTDSELLWKQELPGRGHSSPVLWGERIFLTSADPDSGTRHVLCLSAVDGRLLWKQDFPARVSRIHQQNSLASSTPTVDADRVYCAWASEEELTMVALAHDGQQAWRVSLGPFVSQHGFGSSPVLVGETVILTNDQDGPSFLYALDRANGQVRWKVSRQTIPEQNAAYATPIEYHAPGGAVELIVCSRYYGISGIDPLTGTTLWEAALLERRPVATPIVVAGLILSNCGEGGGNNSVVAVRPGGPGRQASLAYKIDRALAPYVPSLVAHGNLVFLWGDKGLVSCIDGPSGKVYWNKRVGGNYSSSPVRAGSRLYCASSDGEVVALAASDKFEELGRSALGETCRSSPAIALGRMFLRTESHLVAVGQK